MKRIIASAGLAALGVGSLDAAYTPGLSPMETSKPWNVSVAVRGFYDDNYLTQGDDVTLPDGSDAKRDSFGVALMPRAAVNLVFDRTLVSASYDYTLRWYEDKPRDDMDQTHLLRVDVNHGFSERTVLTAGYRFIYTDEPGLVAGPVDTPVKSDASVYRNTARARVDFGLSEIVSLGVGYELNTYDYTDDGDFSRSASLDRYEHLPTLEGIIDVADTTSVLVGYKYGIREYTSDNMIGFVTGLGFVPAEIRDSNSHYIYGGVQHDFNPHLSAMLRAGVQLVDYTNLDDYDAEADDSSTVPFVDFSLSWEYNPGSSLSVGVVNQSNPTDLLALDTSTLAVWASLKHRVTPRWNVGVMGSFQNNEFNEGAYDGETENYYTVGVNTEYYFNPNFSAEAGYNYDNLDSVVARDYTRNRAFIGLRATF